MSLSASEHWRNFIGSLTGDAAQSFHSVSLGIHANESGREDNRDKTPRCCGAPSNPKSIIRKELLQRTSYEKSIFESVSLCPASSHVCRHFNSGQARCQLAPLTQKKRPPFGRQHLDADVIDPAD
jgi:hypothetical protein